MDRDKISGWGNYMIENVSINALVTGVRNIGKICFVKTRSHIGVSLLVFTKKDLIQDIKNVNIGSYINFSGELVSGISKECDLECKNPNISILNENRNVPPVDYSKSELSDGLESQLDNIPVSIRAEQKVNTTLAISKIFSTYVEYMNKDIKATYFIHPHLTNYGTEGGSEMFEINYFDTKAYLTQSAQIYKQMFVGSLSRVYSISPCFRAEKSSTTKHLAESNQLEYEAHIQNSWEESMEVAANFVMKAFKQVKGMKCFSDISEIDGYHRMKFDEVKNILKKIDVVGDDDSDISSEEEKAISSYVIDKYGKRMLSITHWHKNTRPFYSFNNNDGTTNTFDLIIDGVEICSGGQRIHSYEELKKSMEESGVNPAKMSQYLESFKYGMPLHGGFGIGLERLCAAILSKRNIRDINHFPSDMKRIGGVKIKERVVTGGNNIRSKAFCSIKGIQEGQQGVSVKSLIVANKNNEHFLLVIPEEKRLNVVSVKEACNGRVHFADPDEIKNKYGLIVGDVPPFGDIIGIPMFLDESIDNYSTISFSTGKIGEHAYASLHDFKQAMNFQYINMIK